MADGVLQVDDDEPSDKEHAMRTFKRCRRWDVWEDFIIWMLTFQPGGAVRKYGNCRKNRQ